MNQQDSLTPVDFGAAFDAMKVREEHRQSCQRFALGMTCQACGTERCSYCGNLFTGGPEPFRGRACEACYEGKVRTDCLKGVYESIPKRFKWAIEAGPAELRQIDSKTGKPRVDLTAPFLATALERASGGSRMVMGTTGAGKTSFIVAALCAYVRRDWRARCHARFASAFWVAGARGRHALGKGEAPEVEEAFTASLLVLDDLGNDAPDHRNTIAEVLFKRHEDDLPTWVTTGFPISHLENRYGAAFIRRIIEEPHALIEMGKR